MLETSSSFNYGTFLFLLIRSKQNVHSIEGGNFRAVQR